MKTIKSLVTVSAILAGITVGGTPVQSAGPQTDGKDKLFAMADKLEAQQPKHPWDFKSISEITGARGWKQDGVTTWDAAPFAKGNDLRLVTFNFDPLEDKKKWITGVHIHLSDFAPVIKASDVVARYGKPTRIEPRFKYSAKLSKDWGYSSSVEYAYTRKNCYLSFHFDDDHDKKLREFEVIRRR